MHSKYSERITALIRRILHLPPYCKRLGGLKSFNEWIRNTNFRKSMPLIWFGVQILLIDIHDFNISWVAARDDKGGEKKSKREGKRGAVWVYWTQWTVTHSRNRLRAWSFDMLVLLFIFCDNYFESALPNHFLCFFLFQTFFASVISNQTC